MLFFFLLVIPFPHSERFPEVIEVLKRVLEGSYGSVCFPGVCVIESTEGEEGEFCVLVEEQLGSKCPYLSVFVIACFLWIIQFI